ncbi:MAG: hypothetical protein KKH28_02635 [Elusimicrobia bacterium]|nr:hypothetical protein [Elusimicrobiota bacterium]
MRLYLLKLKNKPLYCAAKLTRAILSDIEHSLHPAKHKKKHTHYDLQKHLAVAKDHFTYANPAYSRAIQQIENLAAYLEKIHFDMRSRSAQNDEYIRYSFFLLREALGLIYKDLISLRKQPASPEIKLIAAHARKNLQLAKRQAALDDANFIGNLKFGSICNSLDKCFDCLEKYFDELADIRS